MLVCLCIFERENLKRKENEKNIYTKAGRKCRCQNGQREIGRKRGNVRVRLSVSVCVRERERERETEKEFVCVCVWN